MNLSEICIKRPVFTIVINLVLVVIGILAFQQLSLRSSPKVFRPRMTITTQMPGTSAEFIENNITTPIENALQSVANVSYVSSISSQDTSRITMHFKSISEQNFVTAQSQVSRAISSARLPDGVKSPYIVAGGGGGDQVLFLSVQAKEMDPFTLVDYVRNTIVKQLQQVPGVGEVDAYSPSNALRVNLRAKKMALLGIDISDVINALKESDVSVAAGNIMNRDQSIPLNIVSKPKNIKDFENIIVSKKGPRIIYLKDISNIAISTESISGAFSFVDGRSGAGISITASDSANPIALSDALQSKLKLIERSLPPGVVMKSLWDNGKILKSSVHELYYTIIEAILFVGIVIYLFIGNLRFTRIPIVTIPVCMISGFMVMWLLGFSINLMTLLALILAVGLVVDDAIVVLENCFRHVEMGETPMQAAFAGMREVTFPVIGMTISIVAVYLPTAFMRGKTAVYFQQFSFTLAGLVLISGLVALTLTPMMCARLQISQPSQYAKFVDRVFSILKRVYKRVLSYILRERWIPVSVFVVFLAVGVVVFQHLPSDLQPKEYAGIVISPVQGPDSSSVAYMKRVAQPLAKQIAAMPQVDGVLTFGGGGLHQDNDVINILRLKPEFSGSKQTMAFAAMLSNKYRSQFKVNMFAIPININQSGGGGGSNPNAYQIYLQGYASYAQLVNAAKLFVAKLRQSNMFAQVENDLRYSSQQYNLKVNRLLASQLGVSMLSINSALSTYLGGFSMPDGYQYNGILYPVILQLPASKLEDLNTLDDLYVKNNLNQPIPLSRLVSATATLNLPSRQHNQGMRAASIEVQPKDGFTTGQVIAELKSAAERTLPADVSLGYSQHFIDMMRGNYTMLLVFGLGLVFIYLIFASLFESFIDPLIILLTVPLCVVGAMTALYLIGGSLNLYTGIGLVTLIGLISKHGVLITHFANERRKEGATILEAVIDAAVIRLRPILMTTATMSIGALPLVLASGVGSVSRVQVGTVIIAGLIVGTFFSLMVVPVAYSLLSRFHKVEVDVEVNSTLP